MQNYLLQIVANKNQPKQLRPQCATIFYLTKMDQVPLTFKVLRYQNSHSVQIFIKLKIQRLYHFWNNMTNLSVRAD